MSILLLIVLIATACAIQHQLDLRNIARIAEQHRWSAVQITWTPWMRGSATRSRLDRSYWLRYRDESGRLQKRRCWATSFFASGVFLEPSAADPRERSAAPARPARIGRPLSIVLTTFAGGWLGLALGIGGSLVLFPSSNIAPAYGILFLGPLGLGAGALFGVLRRR